ncbi:MAG: CPBP family intramembrane metalloprotease [Pseudobutyrivibrio sp.]|nr:CPBP family intramembrane metalloprotease [Pseudobutyrivibrio sp.]
MNHKTIKNPLFMVFTIYIFYYLLHLLEYFVLRTDQTWVGEAIIHKLLGILILVLIACRLRISKDEIGFKSGKHLLYILLGLAFGLGVFFIAYGAEILLSINSGNFNSLQLYVSAYAIDSNIGNRTELIFFIICIIGNVVNVIMEEGNFRGLFLRILETKYSFAKSTAISAILFGFWHVAGPIRNYVDGEQSLGGTIFTAVFMLVVSALVGLKFTMLTRITGSLYMSMSDHFVNNTIVNILHVVSNTGADELMTVRVSIAQTISFLLVLIWYFRWSRQNATYIEKQTGYRESCSYN